MTAIWITNIGYSRGVPGLFIDIDEEARAARREAERDAREAMEADGPPCLCGVAHPFEGGMLMDCPIHQELVNEASIH